MIAINKIKGRLAEKSLTQGDVAKAWKCATPTVSQKLNGKRPIFLSFRFFIPFIRGIISLDFIFLFWQLSRCYFFAPLIA